MLLALMLAALPSVQDAESTALRYVEHLRQRRYADAAAMHDATMTGALPAERLRTVVVQVGQGAGPGPCKTLRHESLPEHVAVLCTAELGRTVRDIKVVVDVQQRVAGLFFLDSADALPPAPYVDAAAFVEQEQALVNGRFTLPGTVALPMGKGPFPAVVLVQGSGPQDRDSSVGPNRPLRDLAQGLASQGILSFRYDKRTRVYGADVSDRPQLFTVQHETVDDAVAAVRMLRARHDVCGVAVVGHSLGAHVAPRIAEQAGGVGAVVMLAPNMSPVGDLMVAQLKHLHSLGGAQARQASQQLPAVTAAAARIRALTPEQSADPTPLLGAPALYHLDLAQHHPAEAMRTLGMPTLIVGGARDYQVPPSEIELWRNALRGRPNVTFRSYPALNHLLMPGKGPPGPAEYATAGHVDAVLVADVANFLRATCRAH